MTEAWAKRERDPISRSDLLVMLAFEAGSLTEIQAADLLGFWPDVVSFRARRAYILAEVGKLPGGRVNLECRTDAATGRMFHD